MVDYSARAVPPEKLRWVCDPASCGFETTDEIQPLAGIIGQKQALDAIKLGLEIKAPGYNICVIGLTGTGRTSIIKSLLERFGRGTAVPDDTLYLHNFREPERPRVIMLSAGRGHALAEALRDAMEFFLRTAPEKNEAKELKERRQELLAAYAEQETQILRGVEATVSKQGFAMVQIKSESGMQPDVFPLFEDKPIPVEQLDVLVDEGKIPAAEAERLREDVWPMRRLLGEGITKIRSLSRKLQYDLRDMELAYYRPYFKEELDEIGRKFSDPGIGEYL
ncbi:AAA family ATPase, partial [bacterium]|nr:AAA family ATPase [candidate division CSSED10-310 bacterium]